MARYPRRIWLLGHRPQRPLAMRDPRPDWEQAEPGWIKRALARSRQRPTGGWFVVAASRQVNREPQRVCVRGRALVLWRAGGRIVAGPNACPHMGAPLASGCVDHGAIVCPWHGLRLGSEGHRGWKSLPTWDDGVLVWVRLDGEEPATARPIVCARPERYLAAVTSTVARCDPRDVIQNRLDPWHGTHYHPHSFARLAVVDRNEADITVRVAYRALGPLCVEVDARFHCPDRRTIVMTIVDGEGTGSVVETHATPLAPGRTAIIEAVLATSERFGFRVARRAAILVRPWMRFVSRRLWVEDGAYAERIHALRSRT